MVFGNMGDDSATGVAFTRNPATGENQFYGEFLVNAQGEDVVAGIRTPQKIAELEQDLPDRLQAAARHPQEAREALPRHAGHRVHHRERASSTCCRRRNGKRTGFAGVRIAVEMVDEKLITKDEALLRVEPEALNQLLRPVFDGAAKCSGRQGGPPPRQGPARRPRRRHRPHRLLRRGRRGVGRARRDRSSCAGTRPAPRTSAA